MEKICTGLIKATNTNETYLIGLDCAENATKLMTKNKLKITLGLATNRGFRPKTTASLLEMVAYSRDIDFHTCLAERGYTVAENRCYIVVQAMKNNSDFILMVDDDMVFEKDTLTRLLAHNKEVIGVNSYSRCLPLSSTVGLMDANGEYMSPDKHTEWEMQIPNELFKAYFVGAGILLIDMKVFEKIKKPYFTFTYDKNGQVIHGEDGSFCKKVLDVGIDVWCDGSLDIEHLGEYAFKRPVQEFTTFVPSDVVSRNAMVALTPHPSAITK